MQIQELTDCNGWVFVTDFQQINRRDVEVLWDGDSPVAYRVTPNNAEAC